MIYINSIDQFLAILKELEEMYQETINSGDENKIARESITMAFNYNQLPYLDKVFDCLKNIKLEYFNEQIFKDIDNSKEAQNRLEFYREKEDEDKITEYAGSAGYLNALISLSSLIPCDSRIGISPEFQRFKERMIGSIESGEMQKQKPKLTLLS